MTSKQEYNCVFCKDTFDDKEEFQEHFRKHADPMYKNRYETDAHQTDEKSKEKTEMVSCDVCSQVFPTISKAITHKHKMHPEHDAKYFCPWCGKLFTMKHLYNVHVKSTHNDQERIEDKKFHCDSCNVDFYIPSAMMNHNKFFHRQDSDLSEIGNSKKCRLYNQEVVHIYYCAFCGEEYDNKVNLSKHMTEDHTDENQNPEEVLKCPLCEAVFYHLDAYEIHLTFHSPEDRYTVKNIEIGDLVDYSLESVPPIIEKVETEDVANEDADADSTFNAFGIEKILELAMDNSDDSNPVKVKKHKKRKKSKKAAITLDEFLSMNQDVFGEGLDFQGIEEVPTRVVKKHLKSNKKAVNAVTSAELDKLKKAGIVIKKNVSRKPTIKSIKINNARNPPNKMINKINPDQEITTSSDVLTKLMNQSNNQIKIVKKVNPDKITNELKKIADASENKTFGENSGVKVPEIKPSNIIQTKSSPVAKPDSDQDDNLPNSPKLKSLSSSTVEKPLQSKLAESDTNNQEKSLTTKDTSFDVNLEETKETESNGAQQINSDENSKNKSNENQEHNQSELNPDNSDKEFDESGIKSSDLKRKCDEIDHTQETNDEVNNEQNIISTTVSSLSTLKHLSHLITVKPVTQNKNVIPETTSSTTDIKSQNLNIDSFTAAGNTSPSKLKMVEKDPTLDALKSLSKNITIKSLSTKRSMEEETEDEMQINESKSPNHVKLKDVNCNKNLTVKKVKVENSESKLDHHTGNLNNQENMLQLGQKTMNKIVAGMKPSRIVVENDDNISQTSQAYMLKRLPNITKTISKKPDVVPKQNVANKVAKPQEKEEEIIEIFDIDDSEDENESCSNQPQPSLNSNKSMDVLKNLSKNVTIKSLKQELEQQNVKCENIKLEKQDDDYNKNNAHTGQPSPKFVKSMDALKNISKNVTIKSLKQEQMQQSVNIKVERQEDKYSNNYTNNPHNDDALNKSQNKNAAFKNILDGLGKNITIKSRNSSPHQFVKAEECSDIQENDNSKVIDDNDASDTDSCSERVKIAEIDNDISDSEVQADHSSPIIEPPNDSGSENEEINEKEQDFESEIKVSTVLKSSHHSTVNSVCLDNLRNISKNLTIKPVNRDNLKPAETHEADTSHSKTRLLPDKIVKQLKSDNVFHNVNSRKGGQLEQTSGQLLNKKICAINQANTINKEVTVKTIQTKTIVQEITTTVTKTVKTLNQTVKHEVQNSCQTNASMLTQRNQGTGMTQTRNLKGVVIRQAPQTSTKIMPPPPQTRPTGTVVRPCKQIVPVRPSGNFARPSTPRMPIGKKVNPPQNINKPVIGKPLKISPSLMTSSMVKRPNTDEVSGPFSCFKKPKESLIPVSDIPTLTNSGGEGSAQYASASRSSSNFTSTTKIIKGNSVATAKVMKSEVIASSHQSSRIGNTGVKVMSSQAKQTQVQEKSETSAMKRTTMEAIQRLQQQGLLVKKPRVEVNEESGDSDQGADDNIGNDSADERDE